MRKFMLIILLGTLLLGCSSLKYQNKFGGNNGKPKVITSMSYNMTDISIKGRDTIYSESASKIISHYDKKGRNVKNLILNPNLNKVTYYWLPEYDKRGNVIHTPLYSNDSTIVYQTNYVYNKKRQQLLKETIKRDEKSITKYSYDKKGNTISEINTNGNDDLEGKTEMTYNDRGDVIKILVYDENNNLLFKVHSSYNKNHHIIEEKWYDSEGNLYEVYNNFKYNKYNEEIYSETHSYPKNHTITNTTEFIYDKNKNIMKRTTIKNGEITSVFKQEIEYWE